MGPLIDQFWNPGTPPERSERYWNRHADQAEAAGPIPLHAEAFGNRRGMIAAIGSAADIATQIFYNRKLVLWVAAMPILLGLVVAALTHRLYTAESTLIVFVGREAAAQDVAGTSAVNMSVSGLKTVESEVDIIESRDITLRVLHQLGVARLFPAIAGRRLFGLLPPLPPAAQQAEAIAQFQSRLHAWSQPDTNILHVAYTDRDRALAVQALATLVQAYLDYRLVLFASANSSFLQVQLDTDRSQMAGTDQQIQAVKTQYGVLDIGQDVVGQSNMLDGLARRRDEVQERAQAVQAEIAAAIPLLGALPERVFAGSESTNETPNDDARNTLLRLQVERDHLASQYTPEYPLMRELDAKISSARAAIAANLRASYGRAREERNPSYDALNARLLSLRVEQDALGRQLAEIARQTQAAQARADVLRIAEQKLHDLQRSRDVIEQDFRQFALREAGARIDEDAGRARSANVHVVQQAAAPLSGRSMAISYALVGVVAGLMCAAGAVVLAAFLRRVYILPQEAERDLGLRNLGSFAASAQGFETPEARRGVANLAAMLLDFTIDGRSLSVFQFVSVAAGDNNAGLVRSLALEFARSRGLRTIIVDLQSDGRDHLRALGSAARAEGDAAEPTQTLPVAEGAVQAAPTAVPELFVALDAGLSFLASARALLPQSRHMLAKLRGEYDITLIIAPRFTADYTSRRASALVDANLLTLRGEHSRSEAARALRDQMLDAGAALLGFAFTGQQNYVPARIAAWL